MSKNNLPSQIYGYVVCVIAVITFLITFSATVNSVLSYVQPDPQQCSMYDSFNEFKKASEPVRGTESELTEEEFEERKQDCIESSRSQSIRNAINSGIPAAMAVILFVLHWNWVQKKVKED